MHFLTAQQQNLEISCLRRFCSLTTFLPFASLPSIVCLCAFFAHSPPLTSISHPFEIPSIAELGQNFCMSTKSYR